MVHCISSIVLSENVSISQIPINSMAVVCNKETVTDCVTTHCHSQGGHTCMLSVPIQIDFA